MKMICPECKNQINMAAYPDLAENAVIECEFCGITLKVTDMTGDEVKTEIVDEGK